MGKYARKVLGPCYGWPDWQGGGKPLIIDRPEDARALAPSSNLRDQQVSDGWYVDVSERFSLPNCRGQREIFLGFAEVLNGKIERYFSLKSSHGSTAAAEEEACLVALERFDHTVFCDHKDSVNKLKRPNLRYVNRKHNPAHGVAKHRRNFHDGYSTFPDRRGGPYEPDREQAVVDYVER